MTYIYYKKQLIETGVVLYNERNVDIWNAHIYYHKHVEQLLHWIRTPTDSTWHRCVTSQGKEVSLTIDSIYEIKLV